MVAGLAALCVAELVSVAVRPEASPVTAVGGAFIDRTPPWLKEFAVRNFGTDDKLVLQLGILAVLGLFALAAGVFAARRRVAGSAVVLVFGVVGAWAAVERPDGHLPDAWPSAVGAVVAAGVLYLLAGTLTARPAPTKPEARRVPAARGNGEPAEGSGPDGGPGPGRAAGTTTATPGPSGGATSTAHGPSGGTTTAASEPATGTTTATPEPATGTTAAPQGPSAGSTAALAEPTPAPAPAPGAFDRRGFVIAASAAVAASAVAGGVGRHLNTTELAKAAATREDIVLPPPASPARPVPAGADLRIPGLSPFTTPNKDFYRVDTALVVPRVDASAWRLRIHGTGVTRPLTVGFDDLLRRELIERDITLTCVSNEVGGPYVGNARWIGVRLADLLREAGVRPPSDGGPADQLVARSVDGMTIGSPVETVMDGRDAMLALGMNGEPLPFAHGFPVRMLVPGLYGYVSACKWIQDLELTTFDAYDAYWVKRTWSREAPIKTQSRIDTPRPFASPKAGRVPVAGVAWAQHRGIARVEVRVDGGPWQSARLAEESGRDTWRQWTWEWPATAGSHTLEVRATDRDGYTQTDRRAGTVPNGATGRHSVVVAVT
ncbi:molybdopterin-dependent oxidoreductase [Streptomyces sp. NPDC006638]|uniref:molybdopterin-dependent oxidoreductase n=1 Tax=Streptomyces sp. NPDC006638 TaxID=3157183 RepID=UPI0033A5C4D6